MHTLELCERGKDSEKKERQTDRHTVISGTLFHKHLSHGDDREIKSQVTESTTQNWSTQRALASTGEVYVQMDTLPLS